MLLKIGGLQSTARMPSQQCATGAQSIVHNSQCKIKTVDRQSSRRRRRRRWRREIEVRETKKNWQFNLRFQFGNERGLARLVRRWVCQVKVSHLLSFIYFESLTCSESLSLSHLLSLTHFSLISRQLAGFNRTFSAELLICEFPLENRGFSALRLFCREDERSELRFMAIYDPNDTLAG